MTRWIITILFLVGSAFLTRLLPFHPFFRNLNTMIHEFGHALATLLLSGDVMYIHLYEDHSGLTLSQVTAGWRLIPVALAGYFTASLFGVYLFRCYAKGQIRRGLAVITVLAVLSLLLFVRNGFGVLWLIGFIGLNFMFMLFPSRTITTGYFLLLAFLTLEEAVYSSVDLLLLSWLRPDAAGDATNLAVHTGTSPVLWSVLFVVVALWCARSCILSFIRPKRKKDALPSFSGYRA
ncbi:M50 family metallopeptidase [Paenibacillus turpanensis]|uniref:M50 family metallopeptidase n=1 Tax=Paenibacillus turpanensis TaxID=2689078 RepID=UPI00140E77A9|nr:M50 family metallopeptidase [Paenibacillus turpanensis]